MPAHPAPPLRVAPEVLPGETYTAPSATALNHALRPVRRAESHGMSGVDRWGLESEAAERGCGDGEDEYPGQTDECA